MVVIGRWCHWGNPSSHVLWDNHDLNTLLFICTYILEEYSDPPVILSYIWSQNWTDRKSHQHQHQMNQATVPKSIYMSDL